jgi:trehalose 6-phosphate phosphatase
MGVPEPVTVEGAAGVTALLADPAHAVVALDFDGTLAPIVADPAAARPHPGAVPALARLAPHLDSVAIVTGRPAAIAVEYCGFANLPDLERLMVLGHYGLERWEAATGEVVRPELPPGVEAVRQELPALLAHLDAPAGIWVEDKGAALAVHTRRSADPSAALELLAPALAGLARRHGLVVEPGRMVLELRPPGMDKGVALRAYIASRAARCVLFAGDDLGDLAAYDALETLRQEGMATIKVCSGSTEVRELADRADLVVDGPAGVVALLEALAEKLS